MHSFNDLVPAFEERFTASLPFSQFPPTLYEPCRYFLKLGGKRLRPVMCLMANELFDKINEDAWHGAFGIELFHNFTLIHDDIEDNSQMRRGKPCLHIRHGVPLALNAGDGLFMMVWRAALSIRSPRAAQIQSTLLSSFTAVLEGQARELGWNQRHDWDLSVDDYLGMAGGKTAALVQASCEVGALCAGAKPAQIKALSSYGHSIGIAFQIQDDILNLVGEEEKYKKEIGGDIHEGKRTLMVMHALPRLSAPNAKRLRAILDSQSAQSADIDWAIQQLQSTGSIDYASDYAKKLVEDAQTQLSKLPKNSAREELEDVAKFIIEREC